MSRESEYDFIDNIREKQGTLCRDNAKSVLPFVLCSIYSWICIFSDDPVIEKFVPMEKEMVVKVFPIKQGLCLYHSIADRTVQSRRH